MPASSPKSPRRLSLSRRRWLEAEVSTWEEEGLVGVDQARDILARYEGAAALRDQQTHRLFLALCGLAVLLCAGGVLLLIGYNWEALAPSAKVAIIFAGVAGAFTASSLAYLRGRPIAGEVLAFLGVLLYGCAIWLLAQVFHIESHYPDGLLWWAVGALVAACLVQSRLVGLGAVVLLCAWGVSEASDFGRSTLLYAPLAVVAGLLAYGTRSWLLLGLLLVGTAIWFVCMAAVPWETYEGSAPLTVVLGCALYATGAAHPKSSPFGRTWQVVGLAVILAALVPLTFTDFHDVRWGVDPESSLLELLGSSGSIVGGLLALLTVGLLLRGGREGLVDDWPVLVAVVVDLGHFALLRPFITSEGLQLTAAVAFSALSMLLAIWLIVRGVRLDRAWSFFGGIVYFLLFVVIRWFDLIGDMVSSAILFFVAAGVLLATAWFWKRRRQLLPAPTQHSEARHERP